MDAVKNDVKRLVKIELAAANKKFRMNGKIKKSG